MNDSASRSQNTFEAMDSALIALLAEFTRRAQAGEPLDAASFLLAHPEHADELRRLLPTVQGLANLGRCAGALPATDRQPTATDVPALTGYQILRQIGQGGMGVVYEAVEVSLGRHVALKVLPGTGGASARQRERFRREAQAAARLHHTNIVPVFGVGEENGVHFYLMQFIEGRGLDAVLAELRRLRDQGGQDERPSTAALGLLGAVHTALGPLTEMDATDHATADGATAPGTGPAFAVPGEWFGAAYFRAAARVGAQAADALEYAHRQGILHRDVKPSNLLLDGQGTAWVADFGLARIEGQEDLTGTGEVIGTLRYLAPERFQGACDARSDVYALGLTLYELLTLEPAFADTDRARLVERLLHEQPVPPRQIDPNVPRDLETIVLKAIDKEPARRYQTAGELAEDLGHFLADRPIRARPARPWTRLAKWARRQPVVAALTGAVLAAVLLLVGVGAVSYEEIREARDRAEYARGQEEKQRKKAEGALANAEHERQRAEAATAAEKLARKAAEQAEHEAEVGRQRAVDEAYHATLSEVAALRLAHPRGWRVRALDKLRLLARLPATTRDDLELRSEVFASLTERDLAVAVMQTVLNGVEALAVGPAGDTLVVLSPTGDVSWWEFGTKTPRLRLVAQGRVPPTQLAVKRGPATMAPPPVPRSHSLAFLPDGRRVACATRDGVVLLDRARPDQNRPLVRGGSATFVACDRQGRLVVGWEDGRVSGHEADAGEQRWQLRATAKGPPRLAVAPAGDLVALVGTGFTIQLYRVGQDDAPRLLGRHHAVVEDLAFSGDGRFLASASRDGTARVWNAETGRERFIFHGPAALRCVAFSPDGTLVATGAAGTGVVQIHDALTGRPVTEMIHRHGLVRLAFTADGTHLALGRQWLSGRLTGEVGLCRLAGCPERRDLASPGTTIGALAFHPHKQWVATGEHRPGAVVLWDRRTGLALKRFQPPSAELVHALAFSPDGASLAVGSPSAVMLLDVDSGQRRPLLRGPALNVSSLTFDPEGKRLLVHTAGAKVLLVEVETGQTRTVHTFARTMMLGAFFLDGGKTAVAVLHNAVAWLDVEKGVPIREVPVKGIVRGCALGADGKTLALAIAVGTRQGRLEVWSLPELEQRSAPTTVSPTTSVAISADGRWVAVGAQEGRIALHDARTLAKAVVLPAQRNPVPYVAFAPDDGQLATWGTSGDARLYDLPRLREAAPDPRLAWDAGK
jgi:serine/threonine protein kinase/WD40 repeat protein